MLPPQSMSVSSTPRTMPTTPRTSMPMGSMPFHSAPMFPGPPLSMGPMVPIPVKQEEVIPEKSHVGFDNLSVSELRIMAKTRNNTIEQLKAEIEGLQQRDHPAEQRLQMLEQRLGHLTHGKELKIKAPMLHKIRTVVRESHLLDHEMEKNKIKEEYEAEDAAGQWADLDPWQYIHAQNLVLGRSYIGIDQQFIEKQRLKQEREENQQHPVVRQAHYAGHMSKPAQDIEGVFVKEAGVLKRHAVHPAPYRNQFWLSLDGPVRHDEVVARDAAQYAMQDTLAQRIARQDKNGTGEDAHAVDWLGQIKRGWVVDDVPKPTGGFRMPSWMY